MPGGKKQNKTKTQVRAKNRESYKKKTLKETTGCVFISGSPKCHKPMYTQVHFNILLFSYSHSSFSSPKGTYYIFKNKSLRERLQVWLCPGAQWCYEGLISLSPQKDCLLSGRKTTGSYQFTKPRGKNASAISTSAECCRGIYSSLPPILSWLYSFRVITLP